MKKRRFIKTPLRSLVFGLWSLVFGLWLKQKLVLILKVNAEKTVKDLKPKTKDLSLLPLKFGRAQYQAHHLCYRIRDRSLRRGARNWLTRRFWKRCPQQHRSVFLFLKFLRGRRRRRDLLIQLFHQRLFSTWRDVTTNNYT